MKYKILRFEATDKMVDLVSNYHTMFIVLNRFGINMGFQDQTIEEVCVNYGVDLKTLLVIVNLLISQDRMGVDPSEVSLLELVKYLRNSHIYYLDYRLPFVRSQLRRVINDNTPLTKVVLDYYDEYIDAIRKHMEFEERVSFKYVEDLLNDKYDGLSKLSNAEEHHDNREEMLRELKNIMIKYYPSQMTNELSSVMYEMFVTENLLSAHCEIEDTLLFPAIHLLEQKRRKEDDK